MKKWLSLTFLLIVAATATSCRSKNTPPSSEKRPLRINICFSPATFDPRKSGDMVSATLQFLISEGLTRSIPNQTAAPGLAETISLSPDGCIYTFHLRDASWSDGTPITAHDFVASWTSLLDPDFPCSNAFLLYPICNAQEAKQGTAPLESVGVRALNDRTLEVELKNPTPYFLEITSFCTLFPIPSSCNKEDRHCIYEEATRVVGAGPYKIVDYQPSRHIIFEKNPYYWDAEHVTLESIDISILQEPMTAFKMFETGKLDFIGAPFTPIPQDVVEEVREHYELNTQSIAGTYYFTFNLDKKPFNHPLFRKALSHAIDKQSIVESLDQHRPTLASHMVPPILHQNSKGPCPTRERESDYNPEKAKQIWGEYLAEMGMTAKNMSPIHLSYPIDDQCSKVACIVQEQLKETLGLTVVLEPKEGKFLIFDLSQRNYEMGLTGSFAQYFDPMNLLERFIDKGSLKNFPGWESSYYTGLLAASMRTLSKEERSELMMKAEDKLLHDGAVIPLFHPKSAYCIQPWVKGLKTNPTGGFYFNEVSIDEPTPDRH